MPGVKLNITKKGISSVSVGKNGVRVNMGKRERKLLLVYQAVVCLIQVIRQGIRKRLTREDSNHHKREPALAL